MAANDATGVKHSGTTESTPQGITVDHGYLDNALGTDIPTDVQRLGIDGAGEVHYYSPRAAWVWVVDANDDAYLITMDEVTPDRLRNFDMDAFVNTGCPRITTDDGPRFHKPMLTPGEYEAAIGEKPLDSIEFDTFHDTW